MLLQFIINGIIIGSIYAVVSLGFALVYNTTRIFHVSYAALYMFCPYMIYTFYITLDFPLLLAFLIGILLTMILSVIIEMAVYRPLVNNKSSKNIILVSSIGVMIVLINLIAVFYGNEMKILNPGISKIIEYGNVIITYNQAAQFILSSVVIMAFLIFLKYSRFGIMTRAMRDDTVLCTIFGMNIEKTRIVLFSLSGFFVAIGAGLVAYDVSMDPYVGMPMFLNAVVALIIGGIGRFESPVLGGFIIGIMQSLAVWTFSARWQDAVTFSLLILFLLFRPKGILGESRRHV